MHKAKEGTRTARTDKSNFKGAIEKFIASDNSYSCMSSVKRTLVYWKEFLYDILAMVKKLWISLYFLTLSCSHLRWEELSCIVTN